MNLSKLNVFTGLALIFLLANLLPTFAFGATFKPEQYKEVEIAKLKATPEEYKNKKIWYTTVYKRYHTTFPPYVEKSGIKPGKYYYLEAMPMMVPVIARKKDYFNNIVPTLGKNTKIKIYGKIKKFMRAPKMTTFPRYYLEAIQLEILGTAAKGEGDEDDEDLTPRQKRKLLKKIRRNW